MTSSLAAQIAQSASLNSALLVDRSRRKPTESYLFTSREADQQDLDSIYALGVNAYSRLKSLDPTLGLYEEALFSDAAKVTDRTLQTAEANAKLDHALNSFLQLLGPYLLETTTGKVIEWLVRRFRIHEFNVEAVLALFLPYHDAPHFVKMLSILHIKTDSKFSALLPYKSTNTPLTHNALVTLMMQPANPDFARFIGTLLPTIMSSTHAAHAVHRALIALHTGVLLEYIRRSFSITSKGKNAVADEGVLAWVLPAAIEPLQACTQLEVESSKQSLIAEVILSSYLLLSALSHTCPLSPKTLHAILKAAAACAYRVSAKQAIRSLASICAGQSSEVVNEKPLSKTVVKVLLELTGVVHEIQESLAFAGTDRFAVAFGKALISRLDETQSSELLNELLTAPNLPLKLVQELSRELILLHVKTTREGEERDDSLSARTRSLLVHVQQRYPIALANTSEQVLKETEEDKEIVEQLLLSLSVAFPIATTSAATASSADIDAVVAATGADASVRAIAVRQLYGRLSEMDLPDLERDAVRSALFARVQDPNGSVLEALYAAPEQLLSLSLSNVSAFIEIMALVLHGPSAPSRNAIKAHMTFLLKHLYPTVVQNGKMDIASQIIDRLVFPYLLFSKPRQKTVNIVWDLLDATEGEGHSVGRYELLAGCVEAVRWEQGKNKNSQEQQREDGYHNTEMLARINIAVAAKIAGNIFASSSVDQHFHSILNRLRDKNPHARALAFLICRSFLGHLSGEHLINASHRVLSALQLKTLEGMDEFMRGSDNLQVFLSDASLSTAVVLKPTKRHTLQRLQVAILATLPLIQRPTNVAEEWLTKVPADSSTITWRYVELMRAVYTLANSTATLPMLSAHLIRALFVSLGDDALKFLAGIWLHSDPTKSCAPAEFASLRHAAAFLEAYYATQRCVDFQVVLPAFLVTLQHHDQRMRQAALECISAIVRISQLQNPTGVYAFDAIYGASSADLQYLDWVDICKYVQAVQACREHLLTDPSYLPVLHQQSLASNKVDVKSEAGYKERVLCYLLSHVVACPLPIIKLRLLKSLESFKHSVKSQMLQPILQMFDNERALAQVIETFGAEYEDFAALVISTLDETAVALLNKDEGFWSIYKAVLRHCFQPGVSSSLRQVLSQRLQSTVFASLQLQRKVDVCRTLLNIGQHHDVINDTRDLLASLLGDVPVMVQLLTSLQPTAADSSRVKRAKLDSQDIYPALTLLTEAMGSKSLPGSVELLSCLLDTLSTVIHDTATASDKTYIEQVLMSALESTAMNITTATGLAASMIRLDVLVELIRGSENPQTFNQALLLMATLARLAPEAILRNVMPIFTFMGSNVFHRDDAYSFRVVQKTVDSIVPVMVSSLKQSATNTLDLHVAARDFLRVFTDAANHIPRHRRTGFFGHFVDALGSQDFLAPVCMLLVDRSANKVARQSLEESVNTLSLPLATLQRYSKDLQLSTIIEVLHEVQRLVYLELESSSDSATKTFLEPQRDEEKSSQHIARRQAYALLAFISHAMEQLSSTPSSLGTQSTTELLRTLLDIAVAKAASLAEASMSNIAELAGSVIEDALMIMSASDFINGVVTVMESREATVQCGALGLLANQLANVADKIRQEARPAIIKIIDFCRKLLSSGCSKALREASLYALREIANTISPGEEHALTGTVPVVLRVVKEQQSTGVALEVLLAESHKLGPRLIPYFKDIIKECVSVLRSDDQDEESLSRAVGLLHALLSSIPNFWGSTEFIQVINLYLDTCVSSSKALLSALSPLMKAVAKKAPSKLLLTTLYDVWPSLMSEAAIPRLHGYFAVMKRVIHIAERPVISEHLRTLYKVFLEFFGLCASRTDVRDLVQSDGVAAFLELVVKLNEAAFKPMFRRMFDWAFTGDADADTGKRLVFCQIYMALVDYFKALMTPYMSFLVQPFIDMLKGFSQSLDNASLWLVVIQTLTRTMGQDERVFWRNEKVQQLLVPLVAQIPVVAQTHASEEKTALTDCLVATAEVLSDDTLLKNLNVDVLMHTRSEDSRVRLYALSCSEALWRSHGEKLIGFSAETATFIAECAEDNNDSVVREAHRLKNAVESVAGRIEV